MFSSCIHLCLRVGNSITPDSEVLPKTSGQEGSDTIAHLVGSSHIHSFISAFALFIFTKYCWNLFRRTNSVCCFYRDTITRREAPIYPYLRIVIPHQIPKLVFVFTTQYIYIYMCVCVCVCVYIYIYIYIYIYHVIYILLSHILGMALNFLLIASQITESCKKGITERHDN